MKIERDEFEFRKTPSYRIRLLGLRLALLTLILILARELIGKEEPLFSPLLVLFATLVMFVVHERRVSALPRQRLIVDSRVIRLINPIRQRDTWTIPIHDIYKVSYAPSRNSLLIRHKGRFDYVKELYPDEWSPIDKAIGGSARLPLEHTLEKRGLMGDVREDPNELKGATQNVAIALAPILFFALIIYAYDMSATLEGYIDPLLLLPFAITGYLCSALYLRYHLTPRHMALPLSLMISASSTLLGYATLDKYSIHYGESVEVSYRLTHIEESQYLWQDINGHYPDITIEYGRSNTDGLIGVSTRLSIVNGDLGDIQVRNYELGELYETLRNASDRQDL